MRAQYGEGLDAGRLPARESASLLRGAARWRREVIRAWTCGVLAVLASGVGSVWLRALGVPELVSLGGLVMVLLAVTVAMLLAQRRHSVWLLRRGMVLSMRGARDSLRVPLIVAAMGTLAVWTLLAFPAVALAHVILAWCVCAALACGLMLTGIVDPARVRRGRACSACGYACETRSEVPERCPECAHDWQHRCGLVRPRAGRSARHRLWGGALLVACAGVLYMQTHTAPLWRTLPTPGLVAAASLGSTDHDLWTELSGRPLSTDQVAWLAGEVLDREARGLFVGLACRDWLCAQRMAGRLPPALARRAAGIAV